MAGMFRDIFLFKDYFKMRSLFLLVSLASVLLYLSRAFGLVASYPPSFFGPPSMANLLGGVIFGVGMVLAGGCMVGTLYKMGAGNLVSVFAFLGILCGGMLFAEFYPADMSFIKATTFLKSKTALEQIVGAMWMPVLALVLISCFCLYRWSRGKKLVQNAYAQRYLDPWKVAVIMAFIFSLSYVLSGRPLSVTKGYANLSARIEGLFSPRHMDNLPFFKEDSLRFFYGTTIKESVGSDINSLTITQIPLIVGIVLGSFFSSARLKEFKISDLPPWRQIFSAIVGGIMMAIGALMAGGCNLWHIIGGLPVFALQSILFVCGITLGAYMGSHILKRVVI